MSKLVIEFKPYKAVQAVGPAGKTIEVDITHQQHAFVNGVWVGYAQVATGAVQVAGVISDQVKRALSEAAAAKFGADSPTVATLPQIENDDTTEEDDDE